MEIEYGEMRKLILKEIKESVLMTYQKPINQILPELKQLFCEVEGEVGTKIQCRGCGGKYHGVCIGLPCLNCGCYL